MKLRRILPVVVFAVAAAGLAGCSGGSSGSEGSDGLTSVTVGVLPTSSIAAFYLAVNQGIFAEHGLDVTVDTQAGGAALLPAVASGSMDFAFGSPISVLTGAANGLDVKIASGFARDNEAVLDDTAVVVALPGSGIESTADLAGKTVSVNTLNAAGELGIREAVRLAGGDPDSVDFVEIGFPDAAAQLEAGAIDAAMLVPPFLQQALDDGAVIVSDFQKESGIGGSSLVAYTSGQLASSKPDVLAEFQAAVADTIDYAQAHPDEVDALMPEVFDVDASLVANLPDEQLTTVVDRDALSVMIRLLQENDVIQDAPDLDSLILN